MIYLFLGRKRVAVPVREGLFDWFCDVRFVLKARLPIAIFVAKGKELYERWLEQTGAEVDEDKRLKFSWCWISGWMKEYQVSLRHANKRFSLSLVVRKERMLQFTKNVLRVRIWFHRKLGVDIGVTGMDQMPLHR